MLPLGAERLNRPMRVAGQKMLNVCVGTVCVSGQLAPGSVGFLVACFPGVSVSRERTTFFRVSQERCRSSRLAAALVSRDGSYSSWRGALLRGVRPCTTSQDNVYECVMVLVCACESVFTVGTRKRDKERAKRKKEREIKGKRKSKRRQCVSGEEVCVLFV